MRALFLVVSLFLVPLAKADFIAGAGLEGLKLQLTNSKVNEKDIIDTSGLLGFKGSIEIGHPRIAFIGSFSILGGSARTQYDFRDDSLETAQVDGLKTSMVMSKAAGGIRVRLLHFKRFRLFIEGGAIYGIMNFTYDKEDFKKKIGSTDGYEESESQGLKGEFAGAGIEVIIDQDSGIRFDVQKSNLRSADYDTLNKKNLKIDATAVTASFIQYVDM